METDVFNYNDEPVHYCKQCLSLDNPKMLDDNTEYCEYCGSTEFGDCLIDEWENKFELKYRQGKFLNINKKWKTIMESTNSPLL